MKLYRQQKIILELISSFLAVAILLNLATPKLKGYKMPKSTMDIKGLDKLINKFENLSINAQRDITRPAIQESNRLLEAKIRPNIPFLSGTLMRSMTSTARAIKSGTRGRVSVGAGLPYTLAVHWGTRAIRAGKGAAKFMVDTAEGELQQDISDLVLVEIREALKK